MHARAVERRVRETASILSGDAHGRNGGSFAPGAVGVSIARRHLSEGSLAFVRVLADRLLVRNTSAVERRIRKACGIIRRDAHRRDGCGLAPGAFVVGVAVTFFGIGVLALVRSLGLQCLRVTIKGRIRQSRCVSFGEAAGGDGGTSAPGALSVRVASGLRAVFGLAFFGGLANDLVDNLELGKAVEIGLLSQCSTQNNSEELHLKL